MKKSTSSPSEITSSTDLHFKESLYSWAVFQGFTALQVLYQGKTPFQEIAIYDTERLGRVLVLDGIVQTTEKDEHCYHEMLAHVPLMSVPDAKRVLIIGGGDGGLLRETLKHPVESVVMVEIDGQVIDLSKKYLPTLNNNGEVFDDPRLHLIVGDAFPYLEAEVKPGEFDVILVDSTDPVGPAERLFSLSFYELCERSLSEGGALSVQNGVPFFQPSEASSTISAFRELGLYASPYLTVVPTYYGGFMALGFGSRKAETMAPELEALRRRYHERNLTTKYYSPEIHGASFVLPPWIAALTTQHEEAE